MSSTLIGFIGGLGVGGPAAERDARIDAKRWLRRTADRRQELALRSTQIHFSLATL